MRTKNRLLISALAGGVCIAHSVRSDDFSSYLGKTIPEFEQGVAGVTACKKSPYTLTLPTITPDTKVSRDLFHPVSGGFLPAEGANTFQYTGMVSISCNVDDFAVLNAYSFSNKIFRITVIYARCKTVAADGGCLEVDEAERPYDHTLYNSLKHKTAYALDASGSFYKDYGELRRDPLIKDYIDGVDCGPWVSDFVFNRKRVARCIVDVSVTGPRLATTSVFEIFDKGYFSNTLVGRYAGIRTFIDITAEQRVLDEIVPRVQELVSEEQAKIATSKAEQENRAQRIDELLGANSPK